MFVVAVPECNPRIDELDRLVMKLNANESLSEFLASNHRISTQNPTPPGP